MSMIKDLYAIAEGIDDLVPDNANHLGVATSEIARRIFAGISDETVHNYLCAYAEYDDDCDEQGRHAMSFANYDELCGELAEEATLDYVEQEHLDITDETCNKIIAELSELIALSHTSVLCECVADAVDNAREMKWQQEEYNLTTIIKN